MIVTKIKISNDAIVVRCDEREFVLPIESKYYLIKKDDIIDGTKLEELIFVSDCFGAYIKALYYLRNAKTCEEVKRYLFKKKFTENAIDTCVEKLISQHYLDDLKYALSFIAAKKRSKLVGAKYIRFELKKRGVKDDIINLAFEQFNGTMESVEEACLACEKKLKNGFNRDKVARFMFSRGFSTDTVYKALKVLDNRFNDKKNEDFYEG